MLVPFSLDTLLTGLDAHKVGRGWMAQCPAHADRTPSLSINLGNGPLPVVHCLAGCTQEAVIAALRERRLWPERAIAAQRAAAAGTATPNERTAAAHEIRYLYRDDAGTVVGIHTRTDLAGGKKRMAWLLPDGTPSKGQLKAEELPLYRLPELLDAAPDRWVIVAEGEKSVEALRERGFVATTLAGGASQPRFGAALTVLRGRRVILWPDNDDAGRGLMRRVLAALRDSVTPPSLIRWLTPEGLPEKGDAADYFAGGATADALQELIEAAPPATAGAAPQVTIWTAAELLAMEFPPPRYAIPGLLPEGLMLFCSKPKNGKSWLALGAALAIAYGGRALGSIQVEQGDALYLALEDGPKRIKSRLGAILGEQPPPPRLHIAATWPSFDAGGLQAIEDYLAQHPGCRMVAIDTLKRIRPAERYGASLYGQDYDAIAPLADLSHRYSVAVWMVHHLRKGDSDDPLDLISGSLGLVGAADGAMVLRRVRGESDATLTVVHRDLEQDLDLALRWEPQTCGWVMLGDAADYAKSTERRAVLDVLAKANGPMAPRDVAEATGSGYDATKMLLSRMAREGEVHRDRGQYSIAAKALARVTATANRQTPVTPVTQLPTAVLGPENGIAPDTEDSEINGTVGNSKMASGVTQGGLLLPMRQIDTPEDTVPCKICGADAAYSYGDEPYCAAHHPLMGGAPWPVA